MMTVRDKCLQLCIRPKRSKYYQIVCFGPKRHYRKDGHCGHTDWLVALVKPEMADRVKVQPWGGGTRERPAHQP